MIHVSEEMKTKTSDMDRLTEQIRQKQTLGSTTSDEKIKILTLTCVNGALQLAQPTHNLFVYTQFIKTLNF